MPFLNPLLLANLADKQSVIVFCHCLFRNVKEVGDLADKAFISFGRYICLFSIFYKGVEQKGVTGSTLLTTGCWLYIVIGNGGWDEAGVAFVQHNFVASGADLDVAGAFEAHGDDEGVVLDEVAVETLVDVNDSDVEEWAVEDFA